MRAVSEKARFKCKAQMQSIAFIQDGYQIKDIMKAQDMPDFQVPPPIPWFIYASKTLDETRSHDSFNQAPDEF